MRANVRWPLATAIGVVALLLAIASADRIRAETLDATWTLYSRAGTTSFAPGSPGSTTGYEIVSLAAAGPSAALETYHYGGADLTPPMAPIVTCGASVATTTVNLTLDNGYPYAGCVYLLGVSNTGANPIRVSLGSLESSAVVDCDVAGCSRSDIDVVAGGRTGAEIGQLCSGPATLHTGLEYDIQPGDTFVCPVFVVVLQSAKQSATYHVTITPPPVDQPQTLETPTPTQTPTEPPYNPPSNPPSGPSYSPSGPSYPAPTATPTPSPRPPTPTATPREQVAGEKTPGASALTPAAPSTGSGVLVQHSSASGLSIAALLLIGAIGIGIVLAWPTSREEHHR